MARLGILQSTVLEYRLALYRMLKDQFGDELRVCCGRYDSKPGQITPDGALEFATLIQNKFWLGGKLLWQSDVIKNLGRVNVAIVDPNLRFVSTILLLCYRKFKGLPTVAWGHASGRSRLGNLVRKYYYAQFSGLIAYTESQQNELKLIHPEMHVWSAFNACLKAEDCEALSVSAADLTDFVFVGRLSHAKKPELLIRAFIYAVERSLLPTTARLMIVGDDPDYSRLESVANESRYSSQIVFHGFIHEVDRLREIYRRSIASVSPGYVGLSVTQSTGFGVPMLVARDEPHSPEIEVCREGFNAKFFASDDVEGLAKLMSEVFSERDVWLARRASIAEDTKSKYSFERMFSTFSEVESHFRSQV